MSLVFVDLNVQMAQICIDLKFFDLNISTFYCDAVCCDNNYPVLCYTFGCNAVTDTLLYSRFHDFISNFLALEFLSMNACQMDNLISYDYTQNQCFSIFFVYLNVAHLVEE